MPENFKSFENYFKSYYDLTVQQWAITSYLHGFAFVFAWMLKTIFDDFLKITMYSWRASLLIMYRI